MTSYQIHRQYSLLRSEIEDIEELEDQIADAAGKLENDIEEFTENGSGWIFTRYAKLRVKMLDYEAIKGKKHLQLPSHIKNKQAVINVQNDDDKCFIRAILSALHPQSNDPQRVTKYQKYMNELNCEGLRYPVKVQDKKMSDTFEMNNNISINIYLNEDDEIVPVRVTKKELEKHVDLLLVINDDDEGHYCWIKSMSRLLPGHDGHKNRAKRFYCPLCLSSCTTQENLDKHKTQTSKRSTVLHGY